MKYRPEEACAFCEYTFDASGNYENPINLPLLKEAILRTRMLIAAGVPETQSSCDVTRKRALIDLEECYDRMQNNLNDLLDKDSGPENTTTDPADPGSSTGR